MLVLDKEDRVCGCVRYLERSSEASFSQLAVSNSPLAQCNIWGPRLQDAVGSELALSRELNLPYVEVGGWALIEGIRRTTEAFRMVIAMFGLSQALGGAVGLSTANHRNRSASILRRIGGRPLESARQELPPYHDPRYRCEMEILRFWSWSPNPRFKAMVDEVKAELRDILVWTKGTPKRPWLDSPYSSLPTPRDCAARLFQHK